MLYAIPNLRANAVFELPEPWAFKPKAEAPYDKGKHAMDEWVIKPSTDHAFLSGYEGLSKDVRIVKGENPPFKCHAVLADYDLKLPPDPVAFLKQNMPSEYMPAYLVRTSSGHGRLVWLFEEPILYTTEDHWAKFMVVLNKKMRLDKWLGGLETKALTETHKYFELGREWMPVDVEARVPKSHLFTWFVIATKDQKFDDKKELGYKIPVEDLAKEVDAKFPGRWPGLFDIGARGPRFWDSTADNDTAAVVCEDGILCFTGDMPFVRWSHIFGKDFVTKYEVNYVADIIQNSAYDGSKFWLHDAEAGWIDWAKDDFAQELRCRGYDGSKPRNKTMSEQDEIENTIKKQRRVDKALPFLYYAKGIISYQGKKYLNISMVEPLQPGPPSTAEKMTFMNGKTRFPFIYKLLKNLFEADDAQNSEQLASFLAWVKHAYVNALDKTPRPGHTIVIAGPQGRGKTVLNRVILSGLFGGHADGSDHLVEGKQWTERVVFSPLMCIDDDSATSDPEWLRKFTGRLKKYTANAEMLYDQKYKKSDMVPWFGRIVITCNTDMESLRVLPDLSASTKDKISMFMVNAHKPVIDFPEREEIAKIVRQELPEFARFLKDWALPQHLIAAERRFGVVAFHHSELAEESRQQGLGTLLELLDGFLDDYFARPGNEGRQFYCATGTQLLRDITERYPDTVRDLNSTKLGMGLGRLQKNGYGVKRGRNSNNLHTWKISKEFLDNKPRSWDELD